jgi:hypothetical protein
LCQEVDEKTPSSSSEYTTDDEFEEEQKIKKADWEKERVKRFNKYYINAKHAKLK